MATVTLPRKRNFARQQSSVTTQSEWGNLSITSTELSETTSIQTSLSSALGGESPFPTTISTTSALVPIQPSTTTLSPTVSPWCATGGKIGNTTLDFDDLKPGPLFNPSSDIWFSEGFLVTPPSAQSIQSYVPSSGGQLVEFVPPSLSSTAPFSGTGDTAEIGVGPNAANPCFRFDFHGASLGCAAQGTEQWCEFEISAYTYNEDATKEESIAWSETKRVPACTNFPNGSCDLKPIQFDGYSNLTSLLINLHVGLELRVWWGDDFKVGWTDNGCEAATCRANAAPHHIKREAVPTVAHRGIWHWTPSGLQRFDDEHIWEPVH